MDEAVLEATRAQLIEVGYENLSIEGVARAAGVGKASIYRRWGSKTELALAASITVIPSSSEGETLEEVMGEVVRTATKDLERPEFLAALPGLVAETLRDPASINAAVSDPELKLVEKALKQAKRDGRAPKDLDASVIYDACTGACMMRAFRGLPMTPTFRRRLLAFVMRGAGVAE